jgi:hypothetical protein
MLYSVLEEQTLKKLFKITDELFVFITDHQSSLPLDLVLKAQTYGHNIHWIEIDGENEREIFLNISFFLGKQHIIKEPGVEFAIFLESEDLDGLINHINEDGRPCIRITNDTKTVDKTPDLFINLSSFDKEQKSETEHFELNEENLQNEVFSDSGEHVLVDEHGQKVKNGVNNLARKTLQRLIESGNRPARLSTLKSYILLNNQDKDIQSRVDEIIEHLNSFNEIDIVEDNIIYNID